MPRTPLATAICLLSIGLTACGGGGGSDDDTPATPTPLQTYSVGGAVTGLSGGNALILQNNGSNALTLGNSGEFTFSTAIAQGAGYNVTVATQPAGKNCTVTYGSGAMGNAPVKNVAVSCIPSTSTIDPNGVTTLSPTHKPTLVGVVIDSAVANLRYDGPAALDGTTDNVGQFNYLPGELITFKIGDIALPPVTGRPVITLFNFAGSNDINNTTLVNIARFLQSLDSDGDPANGISIPEQAHTAATGQALDFSSASFDSQAAPIVANAIPGRALINASTAIAHVQSTFDNSPKQIPIAGAWITGSGANTRALILLENGMYYGVEGNCSATSKPGYEFGSYAYSGNALVLAVSADANGACGPNTGARTATIAGDSLILDSATWSDVSYRTSGLSGLYVNKGYIGGADEVAFTLLNDTQYISLEIEGSTIQIETGTYVWGGNANPAATFTPVASLDPISARTHPILRNASLLTITDGRTIHYVAVRPARGVTTLPGLWYLDDAGDLTSNDFVYPQIYTPDGKFVYLGNDPGCPGLVRAASGELGSYAWDATSGAFSLSITGDSNGQCGMDADSSNITKAIPTGNLLTFSTANGSGTVVKPSTPTPASPDQNGASGIWKQTVGSGVLTLLINNANAAGTLTIRALDSNCAKTGTSYAVESLNATVSAPNNIVQAAASTNYDTPACGLPTTIGPTYSVVGDTLTVGGLGTFIRQ